MSGTIPDRPTVVDGRLYIHGHPVCPHCLENLGSDWCRCDPVVEFGQAWAEYLAAVAPVHTVGWSR